MSGSLTDKVVLITGSASGIGKATSEKFAAQGAKLVVNDLHQAALDELEQSLGKRAQVELVAGDISKEETVKNFVNRAVEKFSTVDVLINNAGIHFIKDIEDATAADFDEVFSINLKSMFLCSKYVIPLMEEKGKGVIVNLSSISGYVGQEMMGKSTFLYNMTKAGVLQLTRSLASRYAASGIRVNAVAPGATKTNQITEEMVGNLDVFWQAVGDAHPVQRVGEPEEIANCIAFLASDEASFVTGSSLVVDGGYLVR